MWAGGMVVDRRAPGPGGMTVTRRGSGGALGEKPDLDEVTTAQVYPVYPRKTPGGGKKFSRTYRGSKSNPRMDQNQKLPNFRG
jgi:hypothetical protein